ncbi:PAS domain-containing protein [Rhizobium sp. P38BS-XIX]|uniref:PAS domain-containing protein n=1 Tax=Rhizobium sp. P38BS-XIX TaxID=2726740 RepID=UPI001457400C|nr:PAS domain-containing protein [Rhizobium sp. P38BS-XIX]NLR97240.1 PAS domain-containing protein [Rhizobium sp. P38BS-XIX]
MPDEHDDRDFDALAQRLAEAERELSTMRITLLESNAALHASQERLRRALEVAKMEHWAWNLKTDVVNRSRSIADLDALNEGKADYGAFDSFVLVHPDDRARHEKMVRAAGESGVGWHTEVRIVRQN